MENNMDFMLEFFLIRLSVVVRAHLPSVKCVDHYITAPGFVISLHGDVAVQNTSRAMVLMHCIIEMDMFLMTGSVWLPALVIFCGERGVHAALIRMLWPKVTVKAHVCISFDFCG